MQLADLDLNKVYTYADYLKWTFEERVELIKGKIFEMSPAPDRLHQEVAGEIYHQFKNYLTHKSRRVYIAPFDVRFIQKSKKNTDIITVLQPDVCVVCDLSKLDDKGCLGAPDIVIEILSPGNNKKELANKYEAYEEGGVKEYWIADPREKSVQVYQRINDKFVNSGYLFDTVTSPLLPGFSLDLTVVFKDIS